MKCTTVHSVDTVFSADSVEWCTHDDETHKGYFACGTYQLLDTEEEAGDRPRIGCIYLYDFNVQSSALERLQRIETAAILDMKWLPAWNNDSGPLLATVNGLGEVDVYELVNAEHLLKKRASLTLECSEENAKPVLALAIDWRKCAGINDVVELLVSDSKGNIHQLQYTILHGLSQQRCWNAHNFEAWTCVFDRWSPQCFFSGGDDCLLHAYDMRLGAEPTERIWTNRAHGAGVTCLFSHTHHEHQLLTGSYDEILRLFDTRSMKRSLAELNLKGGIWRIKPHPLRNDLFLTACMYNHFHVVDLKSSALSLVGTYNEQHTSICYGADWSPKINHLKLSDGGSAEMLYMATCSFYDHKLCVSSVQV